MLYTKYRPEKFSEVIRPNPEIEIILKHLQNKTFGHASILCGSRGIGKTTTARLIAKGLNCENFTDDVCGVCEVCLSIKNGNYIDVIEIDGASNRGIEDARELREGLKFSPLKGKNKIYIIDEVHMLTTPAFNALLKSIEEPPEFVYFILCTTEVEKIPETIRSRCQVFNFKRPSSDQILQKLKRISEKESINMTDEELMGIATYANGGFRDAETLLTQLMGGNSFKQFEDLYSYQSKILYLEFLLKNDYQNLLTFHKNLEKKGIDVVKWIDSFISFLRVATHLKLGVEVDSKNVNENIKNQILAIIETVPTGNFLEIVNTYIEIYSKIKYSQASELLLDLLVMNSLNLTFEKEVVAPKKEIEVVIVKDKEAPVHEDIEEVSEDEIAHLSTDGVVSLEDLKSSWDEILKRSAKENKSVETLLRVIRLVGIEENVVVMEVDFKFHAERLNSNKNKLYIEDLFYSVYKNRLFFRCVVENKRSTNGFNEGQKISDDLTDHNVSIPADMSSGDILSIFDGGVPTK
ncbi:MAG: DNA polymerase III subunit gamma/tau [Proteobacteria bacterium]|nr:DNA polymerase III subunit gamma/tau [Pseudomonadota bacterium]